MVTHQPILAPQTREQSLSDRVLQACGLPTRPPVLVCATCSTIAEPGSSDVQRLWRWPCDELQGNTMDLRADLVARQSAACSYGTTHGDGRACDCKFANPDRSSSEQTGCPELRSMIAALDTL